MVLVDRDTRVGLMQNLKHIRVYLFDSEKLRESDQENMFSQVLWNHLNLRVANLRGLWVFCLFVGV